MLVRGSVLLLLWWWLRRIVMMSFVFFHLFRWPVVLVLRFQSQWHWPVHFDFEWSLTLAPPGWRLVLLWLGGLASRSGLLRQAPVLLSLPLF
jgi:hypothetical protein